MPTAEPPNTPGYTHHVLHGGTPHPVAECTDACRQPPRHPHGLACGLLGYCRRGPTVMFTTCCNTPIQVPDGGWSCEVDAPTDCCDHPGLPPRVQLPAYSGRDVPCPKCGARSVETRHKTGGEWTSVTYPDEWLHRRCATCQAGWDEATVAEAARLDPAEVRVDVFANSAETIVRATHLPTGHTATGENRQQALRELAEKVAAP